MKKLLSIAFLAGTLALTGCGDNDASVNPQPVGTAKITGTVYAEFDYTNEEWETVGNKKFLVEIWSYNEMTDEYSVRCMNGTTDANGNYSIEIPVGNQELELGIQLVDFKQSVKYSATETEEEIFYGDYFSTDLDVVKGGEYIRDMYYND